jgi:predicted TIM-barrel fold metal-dependent hydrolase
MNGSGHAAPFSAGQGQAAVVVPAQACDCHVHVYDSRFPPARGATLLPPDASVADYRLLQRRLRTGRVVFVTPSTYGFDNRPILEAIQAFAGNARGVAVVDPSIDDGAIAALDRAGIRGVRLNLLHGDASLLQQLEPLAQRIARFGWHVQLLAAPELLAQLEPRLARLPVQVVFDHFASIPPSAWHAHPARDAVLRLLRAGRAWVKLSGAAHASESGAPGYDDLAPLARDYLDAAPERVLWATDWPHPTSTAGPVPLPDDAVLLDRLAAWVGDVALLHKVLVSNPGRLYGF